MKKHVNYLMIIMLLFAAAFALMGRSTCIVNAAEITEEEKQDIRRFYQTEEQERHYLSAYDQYDWKQLIRMTHLEPFRYPQPHYVLFDYQERNPLNYEAKVQVIANPIL